ncbi:MAG: prepilin-type N-terminal cleavage/methylation domain-containing protein [Nitrospirae bacterium]|nr:prepilin-type N-terminal cleavage/methylation domain-containing protein [Nitrospirota bacterium]
MKKSRFLIRAVRGDRGFTIAELLVTMFIVAAILGSVVASFLTLARSFKSETKSTESQMESVLSLELLRFDLEEAGYGLPEGKLSNGTCSPPLSSSAVTFNNIPYLEYPAGYTPADAANYTPNKYTTDPASFNDSQGAATSGCEPRPIVLDHNTNFTPSNANGSDVLVIKSLLVDRSDTSRKWTLLDSTGKYVVWNDTKWDLTVNTDRAIMVSSTRQLLNGGFTFVAAPSPVPTTPGQFNIIYGVNSTTNLRMPFNRVDYYLQRACSRITSTTCTAPYPQHPYPQQCHPSGYTLYRGVLSQVNGTRTEQPVMDCVIDFQVALGIDTNCTDTIGTGCTGTLTWCRYNRTCNSSSDPNCTAAPCTDPTINPMTYLDTAQHIRQYLKQVKAFVLTHDGKMDPNFTYSNTSITIGDADITLKTYNLTALPNYANYRWKLQKIDLKLNSLGVNYENQP